MRVLIACECSGIVREAFRKLGHDAWSNDLLPAEDNSPFHMQCDFREAIQGKWDFIGFHNDCRVMANSGARWLYEKPGRWDELKAAAELFKIALNDPRPGYVENSIMHCHAKQLIGREQDQTVQPWYFGDPFFKGTCFWLRGGLPLLQPTNKLTPPAQGTPEHKAWSFVHRAAPEVNRAKNRARTFPGMAQAMATQWGMI